MTPLLRGVLAAGPPETPLVGNNAVFYGIGGAALLALLLVWWVRRARSGG